MLFAAQTNQAFTSVVLSGPGASPAWRSPRCGMPWPPRTCRSPTWARETFAGDNLTYQISVTNNGPNDAVNPVVTDTLDANTTYVSSTAPLGWATTTTPTTVSLTEPGPCAERDGHVHHHRECKRDHTPGDGPFQPRRCFFERHPGACAVRATTTAMVVSQTTTTLISPSTPASSARR